MREIAEGAGIGRPTVRKPALPTTHPHPAPSTLLGQLQSLSCSFETGRSCLWDLPCVRKSTKGLSVARHLRGLMPVSSLNAVSATKKPHTKERVSAVCVCPGQYKSPPPKDLRSLRNILYLSSILQV